ncbi:hypothetical protein Pcinc_002184 [Petrolisthes cinctipes]|uniref:DNA-directed RNA polymerase III subunit RPC5 n=1 Tax=Petrolisthes cinctipes TaxID=88211 RepID=A0AAE1L5K4_PETCI|nr:hypothetical protein Pcinc_002184 [Petrolisthes cinctipes]
MRTDESENDPVVAELPVYLAKTLLDKLYVLQYPVRPHSHTYDDDSILKTKIRPRSKNVEVDLGLRTRGPTYDKSKGEQIALNVDGAFRDKRDSEDNYYKSSVMDKLVLTSSSAVSDVSRYAVGVVGESGLHLTPVSAVLALRPSFSYLDQADKRSRHDRKDASDFEDSDEEEKAKRVTVRFEKPETERSRKAKEKSYGFLLRQIREEPWIEANYHKFGSERSEFEGNKLHCQYEREHIDQFSLGAREYLCQLVPPTEELETPEASLPSHLLSRSALAALPLQERVKAVMVNAGVASFGELLGVVCGSSSSSSGGVGGSGNSESDAGGTNAVLRSLQQVAVLVQGNWVVKSDLLYPRGGFAESGLPNDVLQRARDFLLYKFTQGQSVVRGEVCEAVGVPGGEMREVLHGVAKYRGAKTTWEFLLPQDAAFNSKYPEVVQRQQMIWQSRIEQLGHSLKNQQVKQDDAARNNASHTSKKCRSPRIKTEAGEETDDAMNREAAPAKQLKRTGRDVR